MNKMMETVYDLLKRYAGYSDAMARAFSNGDMERVEMMVIKRQDVIDRLAGMDLVKYRGRRDFKERSAGAIKDLLFHIEKVQAEALETGAGELERLKNSILAGSRVKKAASGYMRCGNTRPRFFETRG